MSRQCGGSEGGREGGREERREGGRWKLGRMPFAGFAPGHTLDDVNSITNNQSSLI